MFSKLFWPKISIVTPSFNQAEFIEETILSVINQGYPNLEYIIIDGGSTDGSVEIIRKYEKHLAYWVSEPDRGQAHAINKGISKITGDIFGWINSDDLLLPGSLKKIAEAYTSHKNRILLGDIIHHFHEINKQITIRQKNVTFSNLINPFKKKVIWQQPSTFIPKIIVDSDLLLDESLRYTFDYDWVIRLLQKSTTIYLNETLAVFRVHKKSKTVNEKFHWVKETEIVLMRYWNLLSEKDRKQIQSNLELIRAANHLGVKQWDRKYAQKKLRESFKIYPKIVFSSRYIEFLIRSFLPFFLIKLVRYSLIRLNLFHPNN